MSAAPVPDRDPASGRSWTAGEVAEWVEARVHGDPSTPIHGVASLADARAGQLSFLADAKYAALLANTRASAVLVPPGSQVPDRVCLVVPRPYVALVAILERMSSLDEAVRPGVSDRAVIHSEARLGREVSVGPCAVVDAGARLGDRCRVGAGAYVGENAEVGADSVLHARVVLYAGTSVGRRCILHAGVVAGCDGFGYVPDGGTHRKIPHMGRVVIEDDVEIGANTCLDRGVLGETRIGRGTKIDNQVQVGHNVRVGEHCLLCGQVGLAGSVVLGDQVTLGGQAGVADHVEIAPGTRVGGGAVVLTRIDQPGDYIGHPAAPLRQTQRSWAVSAQLPEMRRRLRALERRLDGSEEEPDAGAGSD